MSNDLINRGTVLEALQKEDLEFMQQSDLQAIIRNCVNTIPTAYDVDKVVERLEEEVVYQNQKSNEAADDFFEEISVEKARGKMGDCYEHAIEIVKAGGVNG